MELVRAKSKDVGRKRGTDARGVVHRFNLPRLRGIVGPRNFIRKLEVSATELNEVTEQKQVITLALG